ncbi:MAG: acetyltransferase [Candidatus Omnitrophota bacterium]
MKEKIVLIGAGGHCRACIDVIESEGRYEIVGIVDIKEKLAQLVLGRKIFANDNDLPDLVKKHKNFMITLGQIKSSKKRIKLFEKVRELGGKFPVIISPLAYVSTHAVIGDGTIIMHSALVNAGATIGNNCIINTKALIEHDVSIVDNCHISTGSIVNGECKIGSRVFIGSNSVIVNNVKIKEDVIIGAGSIVTKSINETGIYAGVPARRVTKDA